MTNKQFIEAVYGYYHEHQRSLPWRNHHSSSTEDWGYRVIVSEYMLQQTQVSRVIQKYSSWMNQWPTLRSFMSASFSDVVIVWSGLGYNRRSRYLYDTLRDIYRQYDGIVPNDQSLLESFAGIGKNTASAIRAYTYNAPVVFIETNIRSAYLYAFFKEHTDKVADDMILCKVHETLDTDQPRQWYYALMDYGTYVKKEYGNQLHKAIQHKKQSKFNGSQRQIRGMIVRTLAQKRQVTVDELIAEFCDQRVLIAIDELCKEGLIINSDNTLHLPNV